MANKSKKQYEKFDDSFYQLAAQVTAAIARNKDGSTQEEQVMELMDAERKFKEHVLGHIKHSTEVYKMFLQRVMIQNKNILSARPYFRETATTFSKKITPAIKLSNTDTLKAIEQLKTFDINYQLIKFIRDSWKGPFPKRAEKLFHRVQRAREVLIENNMPLAINRAKLFYRKTPRSHLTLMDLIEICSMGLAAGIDKYVGKYTPVFRSVCIGRMVGNMIDSYSETMFHFYPSDKRVLYKANTLRGRKGIDDIKELAKAVNESFRLDALEGKSIPKKEVTAGDLSDLMNAASPVSADTPVGYDSRDGGSSPRTFTVYDYVADQTVDIEASYIKKQEMVRMLTLAEHLPILHKKVLKLKGVAI